MKERIWNTASWGMLFGMAMFCIALGAWELMVGMEQGMAMIFVGIILTCGAVAYYQLKKKLGNC